MKDEKIVGWKVIAARLGVGVWTLKHRLYRAGIRLPKLKPGLQTSPVYTRQSTIDSVLRQLFSATSN
jgi:hypothetical protein